MNECFQNCIVHTSFGFFNGQERHALSHYNAMLKNPTNWKNAEALQNVIDRINATIAEKGDYEI